MKKILLTTFILLNYFVYSENTTQDEYNYITKGIVTQAKTGQDIYKRGYQLVELGKIGKDSYSFDFYALYRDDQTIAGYWVYAVSHSYNNEYSLCIPLDTPNLKSQYENEVKKWDAAMSRAYANALSDLFISVMQVYVQTFQELETIKGE